MSVSGGKLMDYIEYLLYEARPYLYAALSVFAFANYQYSKMMFVSGVILAACSYVVFAMRRDYRKLSK